MRLFVVVAAVTLLIGCATAPAPTAQAKPDVTAQAWYGQSVELLATMNREAESLLQRGKPDDAAAMITKAQPLANRLIAVSRPSLPAMEAASDLDELYGRMLLANRNYGWARLQFQKNLARWKNWQPRTPETERRLKQAASQIEECDRRLSQ